MDEYKATLESVGDAIIQWADPESQFTGFTKVRTDDGNDLMFERIISVLERNAKFRIVYANCESNRFICHGTKIIIFPEQSYSKNLWCINKIVNAMP